MRELTKFIPKYYINQLAKLVAKMQCKKVLKNGKRRGFFY